MIDVKVIKKPKNGQSVAAGGIGTNGNNYNTGGIVKESMHAARADRAIYADRAGDATRALEAEVALEANHAVTAHDLDADSPVRKEFLSSTENDRAEGKITFAAGAEFGDFASGARGGAIDESGNAELLSAIVRHLLRSPQFVNGMTGEGFRLWLNSDGLAELELDRLTVRRIMTVFELIIDRIRAVGGQIIVSAANGKIKSVTDMGDAYTLTFEGGNYFQAHDLMRCKVYANGSSDYWVEVSAVNGDTVTIPKSEFTANMAPRKGDECVLMGNTQNQLRQNLISISATEDGQPRIDVLEGVNSKNLSGALRARLGNLDGISDPQFPLDNQPHGDGLYSDNAYLRGTFLLSTGEDIKTKFEIVEGRIQSSINAIRQDVQSEGFLNNPTFIDGFTHWTAEDETTFFTFGNRWIWANGATLSKKGDGASIVNDGGRRVLRIRNKYVKQMFVNLRDVPEIKTNSDGKKEPTPIYLSFFYKVKKAGTLKVGFENINNTGFIDYIPFEENMQLEPTQTYQQMTLSGLWNATGDFKLSFTGEIFIYMLVVSTDKIEALTYKYRTLFEQSEKLIRIAGQNFDAEGKILEESGIVTTSHITGLYAIDENGNLRSFVGAGQEGVKIKANNIQLEGLVTANENFKILADGSIEAANGKFTGYINATSGFIGGFNISEGHIGTANATKDETTGNITVAYDNGFFLYPYLIGFNDDNRQAILGTWNNYGTSLLARMIDTKPGYNTPKFGIQFNIIGNQRGNFAFAGAGNGVLRGMIDGVAFKSITATSANSVYYDTLSALRFDLNKANRFIIKATASGVKFMLPKLEYVRAALWLDDSQPFAVRLTIIADFETQRCLIYGRSDSLNLEGAYTFGDDSWPLMTHWNGSYYDDGLFMDPGDAVDIMLVYDPTATLKLGNYTTKYTARIINRSN